MIQSGETVTYLLRQTFYCWFCTFLQQNKHSSWSSLRKECFVLQKAHCPPVFSDSSLWMDGIVLSFSGSPQIWPSDRFSFCTAGLCISFHLRYVQYALVAWVSSPETCQTHHTGARRTLPLSVSLTGCYLSGLLSLRLSVTQSRAAGNVVWWYASSANRHLVASKLTVTTSWQMIYRSKRLWTCTCL